MPTPLLPTRGAIEPAPARPTDAADPPPRLAPALLLPPDDPPPDDPLDCAKAVPAPSRTAELSIKMAANCEETRFMLASRELAISKPNAPLRLWFHFLARSS
jgi:hypothetical protein